ncbi:MAG TPA: glycoside hydrolase family 2 TIM barrel-domain containing protein [Candidatus Sulfotelmatobacter sp.]|nr:glycoside hydrolase family 2 TIM barrel-domain containing protein [Candidatus Sulfotelmatobacter sp.]
MSSRREFLSQSALAAAALVTSEAKASDSVTSASATKIVSLCGSWSFQCDPEDAGIRERWYDTNNFPTTSREVTVPHTWQVDPASTGYRGGAWYRRVFGSLAEWHDATVRVQFEAVFHTARVWINGQPVGEHTRKGYTAFRLDITRELRWEEPNIVTVRVDNAFDEHMLPRGRSSDWAHDGGIYRPVQLLVTPQTYVESLSIDAVPNLSTQQAAVTVSAVCRNASRRKWHGSASFRILDEDTGLLVAAGEAGHPLNIGPGATETVTLQHTLTNPKLWHFDSPHLYRLEFQIGNAAQGHTCETTFGVRKFEIHRGQFQLNGEAVRLMGVERMAGSNPEFGMAEPSDWIEHDHGDLKNLNCVFTRVHWPQDRRVLDYCDRHGILMQLEVPAWGPDTFRGMSEKPDADIMENGIEQLREMIERDRNHPSVVAWGLCNEINGQNPAAYQFARQMLQEAKQLDPGRLCSYASNSLQETPGRDVAGLMDFVEVNEYFGTWSPGTARDLDRHLDTLHQTFPDKPIVISEYGYCACTPDRPEGGEARIEILRTHDEVIRSKDFVVGAIFFCYNDYRTHVGDRGVGALQQRVHGVVDLYGTRKPSYAILQKESSPIESLTVQKRDDAFHVRLTTRSTLPSYTLRAYKLRGTFYGKGDIPVEMKEAVLPELPPGKIAEVDLRFTLSEAPQRIRFEVIRPTGWSTCSTEWKP